MNLMERSQSLLTVDPVDPTMETVGPATAKWYKSRLRYFLTSAGCDSSEFLEEARGDPKWVSDLIVSYVLMGRIGDSNQFGGPEQTLVKHVELYTGGLK